MNKTIHYRQLNSAERLSDDNLNRIARLLYKTDDYIYPCMFENDEIAELVLHDLITTNTDAMFSLDNMFIAESDDGTVIGIVLWKQGSLNWQSNAVLSIMKKDQIQEPAYFQKVCKTYFSGYQDTPSHQINVLNVCVDEAYQGMGVASSMLASFLALHPDTDIQLHVLAENKAAIGVYKKIGFIQIDMIDGFSSDDRDLPCYLMGLHTDDETAENAEDTSCLSSKKRLKCLGTNCPNHCCKEYSGFSDRLQAVSGIGFSEIILLPRDVENLQKAGMDSLISRSSDGHWTIKTSKEGICSALKDGRCSIYPIRPAICRCYPLYLDLYVGMCELKECPGVETGNPKQYDDDSIEELLSIYEYWIQFYRAKNKGGEC